jgi:hypothetical protein
MIAKRTAAYEVTTCRQTREGGEYVDDRSINPSLGASTAYCPKETYMADITVGRIRKALKDLPDSAPVYVKYGEVDNEQTFVRLDGIEQARNPRRTGAIADAGDPPGVMVTISLVCPEDH